MSLGSRRANARRAEPCRKRRVMARRVGMRYGARNKGGTASPLVL